MSSVVAARCFNHSGREAVARCPECTRFYCRECITEHAGRVICAECLRKLASDNPASAKRSQWVRAIVQGAAALIILWVVFFAVGRMLVQLPDSFHEGELWQMD